jgi:hypothetical protein
VEHVKKDENKNMAVKTGNLLNRTATTATTEMFKTNMAGETNEVNNINQVEMPNKFNFSQIKPTTGNKTAMSTKPSLNAKGLDKRT